MYEISRVLFLVNKIEEICSFSFKIFEIKHPAMFYESDINMF